MTHRFETATVGAIPEGCWVVEEQALRIDVDQCGSYTLMCTPTGSANHAAGYLPQEGLLCAEGESDALSLTAGFLFTEGLIDTVKDIVSMSVCPDASSVVKVQLVNPQPDRSARRSGVVSSSCGMCGNVDEPIDAAYRNMFVAASFQVEPACVHAHMQVMRQHQSLFARTGGTHAAALFDATGGLRIVAEDLGRHNALDKAIGHCLLRGTPTTGSIAVLTGRVSLEMVTKSARAGIELIAAVSAPSHLAVQLAQRMGITLCAFVRQDRLTAFTHPQRLYNLR